VALQHLLTERYGLLLTPAVAIPPFAAGAERPDPAGQRRWIDWAGFSYPFNLSQQPAISVPCGMTDRGLPAGLQIVAAKYREDLVLRAARAFEAARPWSLPEAPRPADAV
jgi:aspartyl-tRNA(Asn)/glutamyl-tRNA(Gln) amidotransferase subunit A